MAAPRKENIKEMVLDALLKLLETKSFNEISLAEVAKAAGISKGTLYYHYKTKGEIFFDLTDRYLSEQWDDLVRWTENKEKDTSIHRLVKYVVERNVAAASFRMQLYSEAQLGDAELKRKLSKRYDEFQKLISEKIAERTNIDPDFLTWLILLLSDGIIIQSAIGNTEFDTEKFILDGTRYLTEFSQFKKGENTP
ncbi:MAG: TetR/AcrR family transcriptional regulator [Oscillospiraceae bacterium]|nr:TetR/AcrR family transcriptional regulator [Oscillospiraceae bacterium]